MGELKGRRTYTTRRVPERNRALRALLTSFVGRDVNGPVPQPSNAYVYADYVDVDYVDEEEPR